ncbi:MAG: hypothetical protein AB7V62_08350 [Thermoleophilia bacterium]
MTAALVAASVAAAGAFAVTAFTGQGVAQKAPPPDWIEGTVTGQDGKPEAGVWVIAEARLPNTIKGGPSKTKAYRKIVATDGQGRFVLPTLIKNTTYRVWVRGYGLRDSKKVAAKPGAELDLRARDARTKVEAAKIYPSNYWLSLFRPPADTTTLPGNRPKNVWMGDFKLSCMLCHQIGSKPVRRLVTREAYDHGTKKARNMYSPTVGLGRDALLDALADWSTRISKGETPVQPPRPSGRERNMVITQWSWGDKWTYAHDEIATDKRKPTLNAYGRVWGVDIGNDYLLWVDPKTNKTGRIKVPTRDGFNTPWCDQTSRTGGPPSGFGTLGCPAVDQGGNTPYQGLYNNPANPHNPMMDDKGRIWMTTQIRRQHAEDLPAWCKRDAFTANRAGVHRQLGYYDPAKKHWELIDTCFATHHLYFDKNGVLWFSNDSQVIGWFDPSKYVEGRPETAGDAQGWSRRIVDTNGDGVGDTPATGSYGVIPNDVDGSVWSASPGGGVQGNVQGSRGNIQRYDPATGKHESYRAPLPGHGPRGIDVDSKGMVWVGLAGGGHLASFDRSKCTQTWGNGDQCAEGWTYYKSPGPGVDLGPGAENDNSADMHYYVWVDKFNTLGAGKDAVVLCGTNSDSLLVFDQKTKKFTTIRIPYPLNAYMRGLDGRIDDPKAGWKGRGLWMNEGLDPVLHNEVQHGWVGHIQMRPNPLAK